MPGHCTFYAMIGYANYVMIIFLTINLNVRNERKMVIKLRGCTYKITHIVAANIPRLPHLYRLKTRHFSLLNSHCMEEQKKGNGYEV